MMLNTNKERKATGIITLIVAAIVMLVSFTTACLPAKDSNEAENTAVYQSDINSNTEFYTTEIDEIEVYVIDMYSDSETSQVLIGGSLAEKQAAEIAKDAVASYYNVSYSALRISTIDDLSDNENEYLVVIADQNGTNYTLTVRVSTGEVLNIRTKASEGVTITTNLSETFKEASSSLLLKIPSSEAEEIAKNYLLQSNNTIDESNLQKLSCDLTSLYGRGGLVFMVRYGCIGENAADDNYSFIATVYIEAYSGQYIKSDIADKY